MPYVKFMASAAALGFFATAAAAQQDQADAQVAPGGEQPQIAQECYEGLQIFGQRVQEEGFWLTGMRDRWGTGGWTGTTQGYYPRVGVPAEPGVTDPATTDGAAVPGNRMWGLGIHSPGVQIETLFRAAQVLAIRGDQEGCEAVSQELADLYRDYVARLEEAGVDPREVTNWRQETLLSAQPVEEMATGRLSTDEIIDRDVRTPRDEHLGEIEDVLISDTQIDYVVVSHGGFLGLGEDYVVVPWDRLNATPGLSMFVLDTDEATFERAPQVESDVRRLSEAQQQQIAGFWQQTAN